MQLSHRAPVHISTYDGVLTSIDLCPIDANTLAQITLSLERNDPRSYGAPSSRSDTASAAFKTASRVRLINLKPSDKRSRQLNNLVHVRYNDYSHFLLHCSNNTKVSCGKADGKRLDLDC
jgi:hypothetical protein